MELAYIFLSNGSDRIICCTFGIIVSLYAWYVEIKKEHDPGYKALCDLGENISCSKVLTSKYSRGFGIVPLLVGNEHFLNQRNCATGVVFFLIQIFLGTYTSTWSGFLLYMLSVLSIIGCLYLAFILFVILKDVCLVCISTYVLNAALLYLNYAYYYRQYVGM